MEKKGGKGVIRKSPLGGLNWVEGAQNQNYAATHTHTHHALRLKSPNVTQRKETWQVKHQGAEKVYRLHPLSQACALLHCILRGRPLQDSNTLFSTKIDTYPGASSCTNKKIINNNFFKRWGGGGAGSKHKPKAISARHVALNGKNQNCVLVRRECAQHKRVEMSSYNGAAVLRH